jgi:anti-anti-sigma factor
MGYAESPAGCGTSRTGKPTPVTAGVGTLEVDSVGEVDVVCLLGEHDLATATELGRLLRSLADGDSGVVVDVSETEFIDASIVGALADGDRLLREHGRRLVLQTGTRALVRQLLEAAAVERLFACVNGRAAAVEMARPSEQETGQPR